MVVNLKGRDCLSLYDFNAEEILIILDTATELKLKLRRGEPHRLLDRKTLAMIFGYPSTRTRVSLETAMYQLGGHALFFFYLFSIYKPAMKQFWVKRASYGKTQPEF